MSTLPLSIDILAEARETIYCSYFWTQSDKDYCLGLFDAFLGTQSHRYITEKEALSAAETFVNRAYIFNCIAYFKGAHDNSHKEPEAWDCAIRVMHNTHKRRVSLVQLYKTIQCIDYNTDAEGWFTPRKYENWDRRLDYEAFKKQLNRIEMCLASHIIGQLGEYKSATWG